MRRRALRAAAAVLVIAAFVVVLVVHSPGHSGSTVPASSGSRGGEESAYSGFPVTDKVSFGMTKQQVLRHVGKPTKTLVDQNGMSCWQYTVNQKVTRATLNAVRLCFDFGQYQDAYLEFNGKWDY
ncbi:MAG TPA: outer membrane protein assembly factor BamE [Gaiellaceae bacterium]|nr:outer membrane protein assembly factor BamE [Gaiellaceae bacterium]